MALTMELRRNAEGRATEEAWATPLEQTWLEAFLRDIFENHHRGLSFGPIVEGAAYELHPPGAPQRVDVFDGYLTIAYGTGGHFHLCIGRNEGAAKSGGEALIKHRAPGAAEFFRGLDHDGHPVMWGFRMRNGAGEKQIDLFFPNPFITDDDQLADGPDWSRLATWEHVRDTYIGMADDGRDRASKGFGKT